MSIAGVDEAGRGPVIGPLIVAGVLLSENQISELRELGVKDSKLLTPKRREVLSQEIKKRAARWEIAELSPSQVDKVVLEGKKYRRLNWLEAQTMANIIEKLRPNIAYVDASDTSEARFSRQIRKTLPFKVRIVAEHHADINYTIVGAASIIAKVHRDSIISLLREKYGDLGSGYPSDAKTRRFLADWIREKGNAPDFARKSWKTCQQLVEECINEL